MSDRLRRRLLHATIGLCAVNALIAVLFKDWHDAEGWAAAATGFVSARAALERR